MFLKLTIFLFNYITFWLFYKWKTFYFFRRLSWVNREIERRWYLFYFFLCCEWRSTVRWSHCLCFKFHISWTHIQIIVFLSRIRYGWQLLLSDFKRNLVISILSFWRLWSECTLIRVNRCHRNSCLMHCYDDYFKKFND